MRDILYIQLRDTAADGPLAWAHGAAGAAVAVEHATLDVILAQATGRRVVLFVPGADVRLASVTVPARQPQKILQAAPYALEDQLAEDVETLHFAITPDAGRRKPGEPQPVAIVARARMQHWLAPFRARGAKVVAVVPETLSLPLPDAGRWTAIADGGRATVRTGAYTGFSCTLDDLGTYLQLADPDAKATLRLFVSRDVEHDFTRLGRPVELLPGYGSALEVLARHWQPDTSIDLLQGSYSEREDWQRLARPWRLAAGLAAGWAALALVNEGAHAYRAGRELQRQEQQNLARYQNVFPGETRINTAILPTQVEIQLRALRSGTARAPLFLLLDTVAAALAANPGLTLQALQYREGALYLSLTGTDLEALEGLRSWYGARREALLEVESANAGAQGVQIRLKLTPA